VEGWSAASQRLLWAHFRALLERPEVAALRHTPTIEPGGFFAAPNSAPQSLFPRRNRFFRAAIAFFSPCALRSKRDVQGKRGGSKAQSTFVGTHGWYEARNIWNEAP